jgi:hypothetical protein
MCRFIFNARSHHVAVVLGYSGKIQELVDLDTAHRYDQLHRNTSIYSTLRAEWLFSKTDCHSGNTTCDFDCFQCNSYIMSTRLSYLHPLMCSSNNFVRDKVSLIRRYTGGGTVVVDENTGKKAQ